MLWASIAHLHLMIFRRVVDWALPVFVDDQVGAVSQQPPHRVNVTSARGEM